MNLFIFFFVIIYGNKYNKPVWLSALDVRRVSGWIVTKLKCCF